MSKSAPTISVVIPSYNYARFMQQCLESVAKQDYPFVELVVIDDRSSDNSLSVTKEILSTPEMVHRFNGQIIVGENATNVGAHETINLAIRKSHGDYVAILNADDTFGENRLSRMLNMLKAESRRFAFSSVACIDEQGLTIPEQDAFSHGLKKRQLSIPKFPSTGFACLASNVAISTGNFLFERSLFLEVGPFQNLRYCHDWDFLLRALLITEPLYVADATYNYRIHGTNSFRSLQTVAASESAAVYRKYFDKIVSRRPRNALAPCPEAWPGAFELFMTAFGLWPHWTGVKPAEIA